MSSISQLCYLLIDKASNNLDGVKKINEKNYVKLYLYRDFYIIKSYSLGLNSSYERANFNLYRGENVYLGDVSSCRYTLDNLWLDPDDFFKKKKEREEKEKLINNALYELEHE